MRKAKMHYGAEDCSETNDAMPIKGKVIVLSPAMLPNDHPGQLFFCTGWDEKNANPNEHPVSTVSLSTGEHYNWFRNDIVGILKPELLLSNAKLCLSQIRPEGVRKAHDPKYIGYCYLADGRYSAGVGLWRLIDAVEYMEMQAPYQYRVLICDHAGSTVMEIVQGELVYPSQEELKAFRQGGIGQ